MSAHEGSFVLVKSLPVESKRVEYYAGHIGRERPRFIFTIFADRARVFPSMLEARSWNGYLSDRNVGTAIVEAPSDAKPTASNHMTIGKRSLCVSRVGASRLMPCTYLAPRYWPGVGSILAFFGVRA
jgi:hypothetical protein